MTGGFLIANQKIEIENSGLKFISLSGDFHVYLSNHIDRMVFDDLIIYVHGYVQPRNEYFHKYMSFSKEELIQNLFRKYKTSFTDYIKGVFVIIIIQKDRIELFTDQFGLESFFIYQKGEYTTITSSISLLRQVEAVGELNAQSLAVKALIHRVPSGNTLYRDLRKSLPGTHVLIKYGTFLIEQYWKAENMLSYTTKMSDVLSIEYFANLIRQNFKNFLAYQKPEQHTITLTGGKDSRTGIAALKACGINTLGFTYGNSLSRDAIYARKLADMISIPHHIFSPPDSKNYFNNIAAEIVSYGDPNISLHRAHRLYAFKKMSEHLHECSAYYAGYMAGEFLMGVYYDNLVFTKYLTDFWDTSVQSPIQPILENNFHRAGTIIDEYVNELLHELRTFDSSLSLKERQFHGIFEIGIPHHSQDVFLAEQYFDFVYPFFIDIDFLEALFQSRFSFFYSDNKTNNLISRYKLYEFNLNIQHKLYPKMDTVPFGKRGSYNPKEFLRGKYYWAVIKSIRYLMQRQNYPPSYVYGKSFRDSLLQHLVALNKDKNNVLHEIYDVQKAINQLKSVTGVTNEAAMHRFTNIVQLYLQLNHYSK